MRARSYPRLQGQRQGKRLFWLCWLAYTTAYVARYNYSAVMAALLADGTLGLQAAGTVSTAYFACYAAGQVASGFLCGLVSPYWMIFAGLGLSGLCNLAMCAVPGGAMLAVWACNGVFQSMVWPPIVRLFAEVMPLEQQQRACVNINSTTPAGTLLSYGICAALLAVAPWRMAFLACGCLAAGVALLWLAATVPWRRVAAAPAAAPVGQTAPGRGGVLRTLAGAGLLAALLPVALHGGLKDGVTSWVPSLVQETFSTTPAFSAAVAMLLPLVNLAGAYAAGWADRVVFHNEMRTAGGMFALALACLALLPLAARRSLLATLLLLALTTAAMLGANTMFIGVIPVRVGRGGGAAAISGILNAATYLGASVCSWAVGAVAQNRGWNATFALWLGMAVAALAVCLGCAGRWARFCAAAPPKEREATQ